MQFLQLELTKCTTFDLLQYEYKGIYAEKYCVFDTCEAIKRSYLILIMTPQDFPENERRHNTRAYCMLSTHSKAERLLA